MYVEYNANNSGGHWWLTDQNYKDLEAAGWKIVWVWYDYVYNERGNHVIDNDGMPALTRNDKPEDSDWLGATARTAFREGLSLPEAVEEWERITGECSTDVGCPCCGPPHSFTQYDDNGEYVTCGPIASYDVSWD